MINRIYNIIRKDLITDMRGKLGFVSSLLYLVSVIFVIYKVFGEISGPVRIGLFWVIILFTAINIVSHSFSFHSQRRKPIYYQLYKAEELITAKLILNFIKVFFAGILLLVLQYVLSETFIKNIELFIFGFMLATLGIVAILTLVSSIASYSQNQTGLVSILSLPLLIPILLLAMRLSLISDRMFMDTATNSYLLMLSGIDILLITLVIIFFPVIWKS